MSTDLKLDGRAIIKIWPWIGLYSYLAVNCLIAASRHSSQQMAELEARAIEVSKAMHYLDMEIARLTGPNRHLCHLQYLWAILLNVGGVASAASEDELRSLAKADHMLYLVLILVKKRILLADRVAGLRLVRECAELYNVTVSNGES